MGRDLDNSREEILAEINAISILLKRLWEEVFNETLNNIKGTTTIVLVTHKLNNLSLADKIIFLKDGRIAEIGNFQDLIDAKGDFSVFYNSQKPIEQ